MLHCLLSLYILLLSFEAFALSEKSESLVLPVGKTHNLALSSSQVHLSQGHSVKIYPSEQSLLISAKKPGETFLHMGSTKIQIQVLEQATYKTYKQFKELLAHKKGLKLKLKNQKIYISGNLYRLNDWLALAKISRKHQTSYVFRAKIDLDLHEPAQLLIRKKLKAFIKHNYKINLQLNPHIQLSKDLNKKIFEDKLRHLGLQVESNKTKISLKPLIKVKILIVEISRSFYKQLGIDWDDALKAQISPLTTTSQFFASLQLLEMQGEGKVLASPSLVSRSGSEAQFLAGGEFPIKIANTDRQDVIWKKHGILLRIKPIADPYGRMSIELTTEISMIDNSRNVDGIPGLKTNRITSHFDLEDSQTIILSGLIKKNQGLSEEKAPGFHNIPIIGKLFKSKNYLNDQSDLVIFVTPEVL